MGDRIFRYADNKWALASDGHQWALMRLQPKGHWHAVSFVRSSKEILARCCAEKGVGVSTAIKLLARLPDSFEEWKTLQALPWPRRRRPVARP